MPAKRKNANEGEADQSCRRQEGADHPQLQFRFLHRARGRRLLWGLRLFGWSLLRTVSQRPGAEMTKYRAHHAWRARQ